MVKWYRSREGEATAADTKTQLTTLGSQTAPGPLLVPSRASRLVKAIVVAAANYAAVGSASAIVRLEGPGLPEGPEVITVGAMGGDSTTGIQGSAGAKEFELDIPVTPSQEILIFAEMCGADIGQISVGVTLIFE